MDMTLFDCGVDRRNTACVKWDVCGKVFEKDDVLPMWIADMDFAAPACVSEAIIRRASHGAFGYTISEPAETQALIDWMKRRHGVDVEAQSVFYTPGVVDSLNVAVAALGKPGEKAALLTPVYGPFARSVEKAQMQAERCRLLETEEGWKIDFEKLESVFAAGTKLLLLCNPHNPVGRVWTRAELEQLVQLTRKYGVTIISDEIHADLEMPEYKVTSILSVDEKAICLVSATKTFNLAALKHSSVIIPDEALMEKFTAEYQKRGIGAINLFGSIAQRAAYEGGGQWLDALRAYLAGTRDMVEKFLSEELPCVKCSRLEGTYLMWLDFRALGLSQAELKKLMIEKASLGLSDGTDFGEEGTGFMRMNIATPRKNVERALMQLKRAVCEINK